MAKNTQIIRIQPMITMGLHLVKSTTKFLPLVAFHQITKSLNYLISIPISGRRKLHFLTAYLSEFILDYIQDNTFSVYLTMVLSVANHQF